MIYLDYQASTPLAPEAREAMLPWLDRFGNPHAPHRMGREAKATVELARERVAAPFAGEPGRLIFTGGATEAANLAIASFAGQRIVTIATEHACVLDAVGRAAEAVVLPVAPDGMVDMDVARAAIVPGTGLVCVMLVNNEIGVIQPVAQLAELAHAAGAWFFCDAVQGYGRVPLPAEACDMVAVSAHKIHGPVGVGALWVRDGVPLRPLLYGGGQEAGLRSGTLSPMLCAGFGAAALRINAASEDAAHVRGLHDRLRTTLGPAWRLNGSAERRYPGNLNLRRDGVDAGRLISEVRSVAFSAGSACASGSGRSSHVLKAIGLADAEARASIRLGFGRYTTVEEIEEAAALLDAAVERQRAWA